MRLLIGNSWTYIDGFYARGVLDPVTSYLMPNYWFSGAFKKGIWDGRIRFTKYDRERKQYRFPTGFYERVVAYLHEQNIPCLPPDDQRTLGFAEPKFTLFDDDLGTINLDQGRYSYQGDAIVAAINATRGILHMPTGSGKTTVGAGLIKSIGERSLLLTHRLPLLYQIQKELKQRLHVPVGIIGDSECDYQEVTVAMVQTLANRKHDKFLKTVRVVIGDEIHHLESDQWFDNFSVIDAPWRFGLSATLKLTQQGMNLVAMSGPVIYSISAADLILRRVLVPPRVWIVTIDQPTISKRADAREVYKQGIIENTYRNKKIIEVCQTFAREGKSILVLIKRIFHGQALVDILENHGLRAKFIRGSVDQTERDVTLAKLQDGKIDVVVAVASILGEGVDLPRLRVVLNATGTSGGGSAEDQEIGRSTVQILGRGCRSAAGKKYFDYVDFADFGNEKLREDSLSRIGTIKELGFGGFIDRWENYKALNDDEIGPDRESETRAQEDACAGVEI